MPTLYEKSKEQSLTSNAANVKQQVVDEILTVLNTKFGDAANDYSDALMALELTKIKVLSQKAITSSSIVEFDEFLQTENK